MSIHNVLLLVAALMLVLVEGIKRFGSPSLKRVFFSLITSFTFAVVVSILLVADGKDTWQKLARFWALAYAFGAVYAIGSRLISAIRKPSDHPIFLVNTDTTSVYELPRSWRKRP